MQNAPPDFPQAQLCTTVLGLPVCNPLILASGPLSDSDARIRAALNVGVGAVVTKTIFIGDAAPRKERLIKIASGALNSTLYSRRPLEYWERVLSDLSSQAFPVIASAFATTPSQLGQLLRRLTATGCRAFELGLCCPNDGAQQRLSARVVAQYTSDARAVTEAQFAVKLCAAGDFVDQARAAQEHGANAICISDALPAMCVDIERGQMVLDGPLGYSGGAIRPIVLNAIYELVQAGVTIPIVGIGGVETYSHLLEYIHLGCVAVQAYTVFANSGLQAAVSVLDGLEKWCLTRETSIGAQHGRAVGTYAITGGLH